MERLSHTHRALQAETKLFYDVSVRLVMAKLGKLGLSSKHVIADTKKPR